MDFVSIIAARRAGRSHTREELESLAAGAANGSIPDYQLSAWLMACCFQPIGLDETAWLTQAMARTGARVDLTGLPKPWVDKHSTGGVGDKTSIVLLPLLAACGLTIVKMSGRGLGITGGTVDKLASIPGFRLDLSPEELKVQAAKIGLALTGQNPNLAPADKVLYALRDVTATVDCMPLIVSSILSKKLAGGAETVVLDVKCGSGAFMRSVPEARQLSKLLIEAAKICGLTVRVAITDMTEPLGAAIGNALEVEEALHVLRGESFPPGSPSARFKTLCIELASLTLETCGLAKDHEEGSAKAGEAISSGAARIKASEWFAGQNATKDPFSSDVLPKAPVQRPLHNPAQAGWIQGIDAEAVGHIVVDLGGGRRRKDDPIDLSAGIELYVQVGSHVEPGRRLATVHAANERNAEEAVRRLEAAIRVSPRPVETVEPMIEIL